MTLNKFLALALTFLFVGVIIGLFCGRLKGAYELQEAVDSGTLQWGDKLYEVKEMVPIEIQSGKIYEQKKTVSSPTKSPRGQEDIPQTPRERYAK